MWKQERKDEKLYRMDRKDSSSHSERAQGVGNREKDSAEEGLSQLCSAYMLIRR